MNEIMPVVATALIGSWDLNVPILPELFEKE
jgi:hypothetical protein